jgi:hypothetical protein
VGLLTEILRDGCLYLLAAFALFALLLKVLWDQSLDGVFFGFKGALIGCLVGALVGAAVLSWEFLGARFTLLAVVGSTIIWAAATMVVVATMLIFDGARRGLVRVVSTAVAGRRTRTPA